MEKIVLKTTAEWSVKKHQMLQRCWFRLRSTSVHCFSYCYTLVRTLSGVEGCIYNKKV